MTFQTAEASFDYLPTTKQSIIDTLNNTNRSIVNEMRNNPLHTLQYYNALSLLLSKVIVELESRNIFDAPSGWYYTFEVSNKNARLFLKHICSVEDFDSLAVSNKPLKSVDYDECFSIINYPVKSFSVEEYAKVAKTAPVTVRQWIRRGKLRSAFRVGGEWRIPAISDIPTRGYTPVTYYVNCEYVPLRLDTLSSGIRIHNLTIIPEGSGMFNIIADGRCLAFPPRLFTDKERIEIEQVLLSNPNISNSETVLRKCPEIKEISHIIPVVRTGDMRLPDGWDKSLY